VLHSYSAAIVIGSLLKELIVSFLTHINSFSYKNLEINKKNY